MKRTFYGEWQEIRFLDRLQDAVPVPKRQIGETKTRRPTKTFGGGPSWHMLGDRASHPARPERDDTTGHPATGEIEGV